MPPEGPGAPGGDVFALGKVLHELSTGLDRREFPRLPAEPGRLPDHAALLALNAVILRACEASPARRHRDGAALLAELEALQAGRPPRHFAPWLIVAVIAVVVAVVLTWWWRSH